MLAYKAVRTSHFYGIGGWPIEMESETAPRYKIDKVTRATRSSMGILAYKTRGAAIRAALLYAMNPFSYAYSCEVGREDPLTGAIVCEDPVTGAVINAGVLVGETTGVTVFTGDLLFLPVQRHVDLFNRLDRKTQEGILSGGVTMSSRDQRPEWVLPSGKVIELLDLKKEYGESHRRSMQLLDDFRPIDLITAKELVSTAIASFVGRCSDAEEQVNDTAHRPLPVSDYYSKKWAGVKMKSYK